MSFFCKLYLDGVYCHSECEFWLWAATSSAISCSNR